MKSAAITMTALAVSIAMAAAGCGGAAEGRDTASTDLTGEQVIVALDLSGSQSQERRAEARRAVELAIDGLQYGDRIVLLQVHQRSASEDDAVRWQETVPMPEGEPTSLDRERLDAVKQAARSVARSIFENETAGRLPTTDLFATLHMAAEYTRGETMPTSIVLLSDMLQSAHGVEMSRDGGVPATGWIEEQRERGVLPQLNGACVTVIGADASTANGVAVRDFWTHYFDRAGAELAERNYRLIAASPDAVTCRPT